MIFCFRIFYFVVWNLFLIVLVQECRFGVFRVWVIFGLDLGGFCYQGSGQEGRLGLGQFFRFCFSFFQSFGFLVLVFLGFCLRSIGCCGFLEERLGQGCLSRQILGQSNLEGFRGRAGWNGERGEVQGVVLVEF